MMTAANGKTFSIDNLIRRGQFYQADFLPTESENLKSATTLRKSHSANENIYAAEYKLYLPDAKLLQRKLREWIAEEEGK